MAVYAAALFGEIINYYVVIPTFSEQPAYQAEVYSWSAMILSKCNNQAAIDEGFTTKSLIQTGLITIGFGAYVGLLVESKTFNG